MTAGAHTDAAAIAADAQQRAAAVRQETIRQVLADTRAEAAGITSSAEAQAAQERALTRLRIPELAQRAVAMVAGLPDEGLPDGSLRDEDQGPPRGGPPDPSRAPGRRS